MPRSSNFGGVALRDAGVWSRSSGKGECTEIDVR